jgi:hypothetical protein
MRQQFRQPLRRRGKAVLLAAAAVSALFTSVPAFAQTELPDTVVDALNTALADELKALATYEAILDAYGDVRPFENIAEAEQTHVDALLELYERYDVDVPDIQVEIDPDLTDLSLTELSQLGVDGEIENIRMYEEDLLPVVEDYEDIYNVMESLRDASLNNHLPAFERAVESPGDGTSGSGGESGNDADQQALETSSADRPETRRPEGVERPDTPERPEHPEAVDRPERPQRPEHPEHPETAGPNSH